MQFRLCYRHERTVMGAMRLHAPRTVSMRRIPSLALRFALKCPLTRTNRRAAHMENFFHTRGAPFM
jgi:hypothetical protein